MNLGAIINSVGVKLVQRGTTAGAGNVTITAVNLNKTFVRSASKGSAGYVAARGSISLATPVTDHYRYDGNEPLLPYSSLDDWSSTGGWPPYSGSISGGSTDLTVKQYSAKLTNATTLYADGPVEYEVIEYY